MIAAVVVTHSAPSALLDRCVGSLVDECDLVLVVDTAGRRERGELLTVTARDRVEVIATDNRGYGAAANVGFVVAETAGASAIVLANDDVVGRVGWVGALLGALDDPTVGAAQPVLIRAGTGRVNSRGVVIGPDGAGIDDGDGEPHVPRTGVEPIELFTGGAVAFRTAFLTATGGFDERWFLYYEDVDLGRRGAALGWRYVVVLHAVVEHVGGSSTSADSNRTRFLQERNRLWAAFRHGGAATARRALWLSVRRLRHPPRRVHARALLAGLGGLPWALRARRDRSTG